MSVLARKLMGGVANFATLTHRQAYNSSSASSEYVVGSSIAIGDAPTGGNRRFVVVAASSASGANGTTFAANCVEIGTNNTVADVELARVNGFISSGTASAVIAYSEISSGTTVRVSVNAGNSRLGLVASVWTIETGPAGLTASALTEIADNSSPTVTFTDCLEDDIFVATIGWVNGSASSWQINGAGGGTEHNDVDLVTNEWCSTWSTTLTADDTSVPIGTLSSGNSVGLAVARFRAA